MNLTDLSIKKLSDLLYTKLNELNYEIILSYPTTDGVYPCIEMFTPLKNVDVTENAVPVVSTFQVSICCWNDKQRGAMEMTDEAESKLRDFNLIKISTSQAVYDDVVQKYGITSIYEVKFNSITNSFKFIN